MLVLSRKCHEQIRIGSDIVISVLKIDGNKVRIGIEAPREIHVRRAEVPPHLPPSADPPAPTDVRDPLHPVPRELRGGERGAGRCRPLGVRLQRRMHAQGIPVLVGGRDIDCESVSEWRADRPGDSEGDVAVRLAPPASCRRQA